MIMIGLLPICVCLILSVINVTNGLEDSADWPGFLMVKPNSTVKFPFPSVSTYQRMVMNPETFAIGEHVFRICNGNNEAICGFWEDVETKKLVESGATRYDEKEKVLVIEEFRLSDQGSYTAGNDTWQTIMFNSGF